MKVKNTIPLAGSKIIDYITDNLSLRTIESTPHATITTLDPDTLGIMSRFTVETYPHNFYKACLDDDCIYLPTKTGQILAIDKFSGQILTTVNLGMPIMSNIFQDEQNIYCICGVPISTKWKLIVDNFCVCVCSKEDGKKLFQTNYFSGPPVFLTLSENSFWVVSDKKISEYDKNGELLQEQPLVLSPDYPIVLNSKYVIITYRNGTAMLLNRSNLALICNIKAKSNLSGPILIENNILAWSYKQGMCYINLKNKTFQTIQTEYELLSNIAYSSLVHETFVFNNKGHILSFNIQNNQVQSIKLTPHQLQHLILVNDDLFVSSGSHLHQIGATI